MTLTELLMFLLKNWKTVIKPLLDELNLSEQINEFIDEIFKGVNHMDNKLYLEKTNCVKDFEIKAAYMEAVNGNYKYYRAVSRTNKKYFWDEKNNHYKIMPEGTEWAENPHYVAPKEETVEDIAEEATIALAEEAVVEADIEPETAETEEVEETPAASTIEAVEAKTEAVQAKVEETVPLVQAEAVNYKALYEELEKKFAEQEEIALKATEKMLKIKNAMKQAAEIMIEAIGD